MTQDNPTTRDFLSLLPLTIAFEEFSGREKIGYLPRDLDTEGAPGHDREAGDLICFAPWGNLGFRPVDVSHSLAKSPADS